MSEQIDTRSACNWLALCLDSTIMNGVPHGILQRPTSDAFLTARIEQMNDAVVSLEGISHGDEQLVLLDNVKKQFGLVRQKILHLYHFAQLSVEDIQRSVTELIEAYGVAGLAVGLVFEAKWLYLVGMLAGGPLASQKPLTLGWGLTLGGALGTAVGFNIETKAGPPFGMILAIAGLHLGILTVLAFEVRKSVLGENDVRRESS